MAGNIKGITIEFQGDTTKLDKALRDVNKETKSIDRELRAVNKSLKFNPTSVELWRQKQQLLTQKVEETKKKLDILKQAQQKMDADGVDKNTQEYRELQRQIIETESKAKHFKGELDKIGNAKLQALGNQFKSVGDKMKGVGDNMTKYVTGPIVAGAGLSVAAWKDVDNGLDIVTQKTGASGKSLEGMQESVKNLTQQIPTDFATAGAAVGEVNTRFGLTGQALEDLSAQFIKFADLNDTDVSTSVDKVQKAMEAFNVPASEAGNMLDVLNKVGQDTGISMDTLTDSMVTNAPQLQAMGLNASQAATFLGQLETSGIDSNKAMVGLNKAIVQGAKEGKTLPEVMSEIQSSIVGASNETDAMNAAVEIFGSKAGPAIATAARNGSLDFQALASAATDASGSVDKTFEGTQDPADKFQTMMNSLKVTGYEVADSLFTLLAPALEAVSGWLQKAAGWWQGLSPEMQKVILAVAGIVAAIGPLLMIIGSLASAIGSIITIAPMIGTAFSALAGPVGIVIGIIAALIAIGVLLYKNWDKIKAAAGALKNWVVEKFTALKTKVAEIFTKIKDAMLKPIRKARDLIKAIIDKIKGFFNFKAKLPKIKLPHFSIQPPGWSIGDLLHGEIPSLGIDWYAKGGIFNSPRVIGVGDSKSPEAVIPIDKLQGMINASNAQMVSALVTALQAANMGGGSGSENTIVIKLGGATVATEIFKLNKQGKLIMEA